MSIRSNATLRRVTVVFADAYHTLKLVEAMASVRVVHTKDRDVYRVDKNAAEACARLKLGEKEDDFSPKYDFVGILVAHIGTLDRGRISWAEEIEVAEAVTV